MKRIISFFFIFIQNMFSTGKGESRRERKNYSSMNVNRILLEYCCLILFLIFTPFSIIYLSLPITLISILLSIYSIVSLFNSFFNFRIQKKWINYSGFRIQKKWINYSGTDEAPFVLGMKKWIFFFRNQIYKYIFQQSHQSFDKHNLSKERQEHDIPRYTYNVAAVYTTRIRCLMLWAESQKNKLHSFVKWKEMSKRIYSPCLEVFRSVGANAIASVGATI